MSPVIGDAGQVAVPPAPGQLVDTDQHQPLEPLLIEPVGDDPLDDPPAGLPVDPIGAAIGRPGHLLGEERDAVLEVARVARARSGPTDPLDPDAAVGAADPPPTR